MFFEIEKSWASVLVYTRLNANKRNTSKKDERRKESRRVFTLTYSPVSTSQPISIHDWLCGEMLEWRKQQGLPLGNMALKQIWPSLCNVMSLIWFDLISRSGNKMYFWSGSQRQHAITLDIKLKRPAQKVFVWRKANRRDRNWVGVHY